MGKYIIGILGLVMVFWSIHKTFDKQEFSMLKFNLLCSFGFVIWFISWFIF